VQAHEKVEKKNSMFFSPIIQQLFPKTKRLSNDMWHSGMVGKRHNSTHRKKPKKKKVFSQLQQK
jgi:hypothetical protein